MVWVAGGCILRSMDRKRFIAECSEFLGIRKKLRVFLYRKKLPSKAAIKCAGYYQPKESHHLIQVSITNSVNRGGWHNILAHELVHAWQMENYPDSPDHGDIFQKSCAKLELYFSTIHGFELGNLYVPELDK